MADECNVQPDALSELGDRLTKYGGWLKALVASLFFAGVAVGSFAVNANSAMRDAVTAKASVETFVAKQSQKDVDQAQINTKLLYAVEALTERLREDSEQKKSMVARIERLEANERNRR